MASVVLELQREALDRTTPVSDVLRKALVVSHKLRIVEFEQWINLELTGYGPETTVPEYRIISGSVRGWNPYHGWVPVEFEDPAAAAKFARRPCGQCVAGLEDLISKPDKANSLQMPFTPDIEKHFRDAIEFRPQVTFITHRVTLVGILDSVRTVVLNWCLKLEEDGILGEGLSFSSKERESAGAHTYNVTNFYGPARGTSVQQAGRASTQIATMHALDVGRASAFLADLERRLPELDLAEPVQRELAAEVATAKAQLASPRPKQGILSESLSSVQRILEGTAGNLAAQLVTQLALAMATRPAG